MAETRSTFDWQEVYTRLEQTRRSLEAGGALPPEATRRILRERAQALARPLAEAPTAADVMDLLVFSLAGERFGIATAHVLEVTPLRELTPVPCTPPSVLGVVNHRGRLLAVLDCRRLLALAPQGVAAGSRVVAVQAGGMTFGILADAVVGTIRVGAHEVIPPPETLRHDRQTFLRGVTREMVALLDLEALARDPQVVVDEEVG